MGKARDLCHEGNADGIWRPRKRGRNDFRRFFLRESPVLCSNPRLHKPHPFSNIIRPARRSRTILHLHTYTRAREKRTMMIKFENVFRINVNSRILSFCRSLLIFYNCDDPQVFQ